MSTVVMKFGGASMASVERISALADLIETRKKEFINIVAVVSAMGSATDDLMDLSRLVHPNPPKRELDMLISVGERISMSLLAMALDFRGLDAISFTGSQSGIITTERHSEAEILEVRPKRVSEALQSGKIVIVAGFQGVSHEKEITTLGRGGSDTSAVALAAALNAKRVEFYKDVRGIGKDNPKKNPEAEIYSSLSYDQALEIVGKGAEILHERSLNCAKKEGVPLEIRFFDQPEIVGTYVSSVC